MRMTSWQSPPSAIWAGKQRVWVGRLRRNVPRAEPFTGQSAAQRERVHRRARKTRPVMRTGDGAPSQRSRQRCLCPIDPQHRQCAPPRSKRVCRRRRTTCDRERATRPAVPAESRSQVNASTVAIHASAGGQPTPQPRTCCLPAQIDAGPSSSARGPPYAQIPVATVPAACARGFVPFGPGTSTLRAAARNEHSLKNEEGMP